MHCVQWDGTHVAISMIMLSLLCTIFFIPAMPGVGYEVRGNGEMFPLNGPCWSLFFEYIGNILYALFIRRLSNKALAVREVFFTVNGWPVVSPERYAGTAPRSFTKEDLVGEWEIIRIQEPPLERSLEAGQILWGEGDLRNGEQALSARVVLEADGSVGDATWDFNVKKQLLTIKTATEDINNLIIFAGHDWENETETILFTGLDAQGHSVWGKRID